MNSKKPNVYYIPVGITSFQKDLIECFISLHAKAFKNELGIEESSSVKLEEKNVEINNKSLSTISNIQMTYLFDNGIRSILNHPCLIVDHYMSRQFLLMEPTERLISSSDKFKQMNSILSGLIYRKREIFPNVLKIALVSHSVRELDIIESFTLGKKLKIKRFSGNSLYKEDHVYPIDAEQSSTSKNKRRKKDSSSEPSTSHDSSPSISTANKYTGYAKDDYDYSMKRKKNVLKTEDEEDWLFLTTSNHLLNNPKLLSDYDIDIIISFDPLLDPNLEAFKNIKDAKNVRKSKKIPIIKLLVQDSPDHYILEKKLLHKRDEYNNILNSIKHFLNTRNAKLPTTTITYKSDNMQEKAITNPQINFTELIEKLLREEDVSSLLPEINFSTEDHINDENEIINSCITALSPLDYSDLKFDNNICITDVKTYQSIFMERAMKIMNSLKNEYSTKMNIILNKRLEATETQNRFDEIKHNIGESFKNFQELEKVINNSEKRLERIQTENNKLETKLSTLNRNNQQIIQLMEIKDESELKEKSKEYSEHLNNFTIKLESIKEQNKLFSNNNEELRLTYQEKSSKAAELAQTLKFEKENLERIKKVVEGPTASLEYQTMIDLEERLKIDMNIFKKRNNLLKSYIEQVAKQYEANRTGNKTSKSMVSSDFTASIDNSNQPQSSYGRHRSTRAHTPSYK